LGSAAFGAGIFSPGGETIAAGAGEYRTPPQHPPQQLYEYDPQQPPQQLYEYDPQHPPQQL
jgi:hypothetical protein